jgi:hypothetical protein
VGPPARQARIGALLFAAFAAFTAAVRVARDLLVERRGGAAVAMGLGPTDTKGFIGSPGAVDEPLIPVGDGALAGKAVQNLSVVKG